MMELIGYYSATILLLVLHININKNLQGLIKAAHYLPIIVF